MKKRSMKEPKNIYHTLSTKCLALCILLLAACTSDDSTSPATGSAISLSAAVEGPQTRAGQEGCIDDGVLRTTGFGVFANSATEGYSSGWLSNGEVAYAGSVTDELGEVHIHPNLWSYGTSKDWPADGSISFYAYAPYVAAGSGTKGITAIDASNADAPAISYQVGTKPSECVDLLWGIRGTTGVPWTATTLATTGGNVLFTFHHAMAALGYHVQAIVDKNNNLTDLGDESETGYLGTNCKVTIKSIKLQCTSGSLYQTAKLNLHNTVAYTPLWSNQSGSLTEFTISGDEIDPKLLDPAPAATDASIRDNLMNVSSITGVTESANSQLVIARNGTTDKEQCWMFIPEAGDKDYTVTVEYYVTFLTATGHYTRLDYTGANAGKATISGLELKPDTKYYLNLVIGLHSFYLDVTATDWQEQVVPVSVTIEQGTSASESLARGVRNEN